MDSLPGLYSCLTELSPKKIHEAITGRETSFRIIDALDVGAHGLTTPMYGRFRYR